MFKERNQVVKVRFSKFVDLRPKNCVITGTSGTQCLCAHITSKC